MNKTLISSALAASLLIASSAAATDPELHPIDSVDELKEAFNGDRGVPRVVLLLSPT